MCYVHSKFHENSPRQRCRATKMAKQRIEVWEMSSSTWPKVCRDGSPSTRLTAGVLRQRQTNFRRRSAKNGLLAETRMDSVGRLAPRSISLGRRGSRCQIARRPEAACVTHACSACTRRRGDRDGRSRAPSRWSRRGAGLLVRIGRLSRVYHSGTMRPGIAHCCLYLRAAA